MKLVITLNQKESLYDYLSMGIETYVIGGKYSFHCPHIFSLEDMKMMKEQYPQCSFYVSMNALYDQHVMKDIENYIEQLNEIEIEGIIFQDFGILQIVKEHQYSFDMMYAPETLNTNAQALKVLQDYGITSAFLSHVIPLEEQIQIQQQITLPLMMQGHGVEYVAASKRHLLRNYQEVSHLSFDKNCNHLTMMAYDSDMPFHIYEDEMGTHIFTQKRLFTLDLLNQIKDFDYWYIETLMMSQEEAIEIASLYSDALKSLERGTYDKDVKEYMLLLYQLHKPLDRGFLFDQTVYKLEDVRKMENEKSESSH